MNNLEASFFHTGSIAEYHDPFLRQLLAKYVRLVESEADGDRVLSEDDKFREAVSKYKQIVTHYFACKTETWFASVLGPVLGLVDALWRYEFAKTRGAIHFHSILTTMSGIDSKLSKAMAVAAREIYDAVLALEASLQGIPVTPMHPGSLFESSHSAEDVMKAAETFLGVVAGGDVVWKQYTDTIANITEKASEVIKEVMSLDYVFSAFHPGSPPAEWLEPHGRIADGYRGGCDGMLSKEQVLAAAELRQFKFQREDHLYDRSVNIVNHVRCHRCSDYCWRDEFVTELFNETKHLDPATKTPKPNVTKVFSKANKDGVMLQWAKIRTRCCRMGYGYALTHGRGPSKDRTGGIPAASSHSVVFDSNGVPKFAAARNHHRVTQEPLVTHSWGANADLQRFLGQNISVPGLDPDASSRQTFYTSLFLAGREGFCRFSCSDSCQRYATGYCCKGSKASLEWSKTLQQIASAYVNNDPLVSPSSVTFGRGRSVSLPRAAHAGSGMGSVVTTFMRSLGRARDVPKDEACFSLSGGSMTGTTLEVRHCSVSSIAASDVVRTATAAADPPESATSSSFTITNLKTRYRGRDKDDPALSELTMYEYAATKLLKTRVVPMFYGFNDNPSWPLDENYSQITLMLHKKWDNDVTELKAADGTYATTLEEYMFDDRFPQRIAVQIMQKKMKWVHKQDANSSLADTGAVDSTPTSQREDDLNSDAAAAAVMHDPNIIGEHSNEEEISDDFLDTLPPPPDGYDWSAGRSEGAEVWLHNYKQEFYRRRTAGIVAGSAEPLVLFNPDVYRPENAKGHSQRLLVFGLIYQIKTWLAFLSAVATSTAAAGGIASLLVPAALWFYVQGNPGSGKTYTQRTMLNVVHRAFHCMESAKAIAPTGTAASLLLAETSFRLLKYPIGAKSLLAPDCTLNESLVNVQSHIISICELFALFSDESSMDCRQHLAWRRERIEAARTFQPELAGLPVPDPGSSPTYAQTLARVQKENGLKYVH